MRPTTASVRQEAPLSDLEQEYPWRRLSLRMLAVHPLQEAARLMPAVVGIVFLGRHGEQLWGLLGFVAALGLGLARWFTTSYRVTDHHVQVRRGILRREVLSVPRDRIRSVDVSSGVLQRVLGIQRLVIGTGRSDRHGDGLVLDALNKAAASRLRDELLHRSDQTAVFQPRATSEERSVPAAARPRPTGAAKRRPTVSAPALPPRRSAVGEQVITEFQPGWVRFGFFTTTGLAGIGVLLTSFTTFLNGAKLGPDRFPVVRALGRQLTALPILLSALEVALLVILAVALLSGIRYAFSFWDFRLVRLEDGTLRLTRGLATTRSITIEERRLGGVEISETLPLRLVHGARCIAITTGLRVGRGAEHGGSLLLPPAPLAEARKVGAAVSGAAAAMDCPLIEHGDRAKRRRSTRACIGALAITAAIWALTVWAGWPTWSCAASLVLLPPLAELVARDRYRNLGHALRDGYLIIREGSLVRRRYVLAERAIVGWVFHASFFQRLSGLTTLTAATAAGRQYYNLVDLPADTAAALADTAAPTWLEPFLVGGTEQSRSSRPENRPTSVGSTRRRYGGTPSSCAARSAASSPATRRHPRSHASRLPPQASA